MATNRETISLDAGAAARRMDKLGARREAFLFLIDFLQENSIVLTPHEATEGGILFDFNGRTNTAPLNEHSPAVSFRKQPPDLERYKRAFSLVQQHIRNGDSYLLNLTQPTRIEVNLSLHQIFNYSKAKYRILVPEKFVVFSPETFVQMKGSMIVSCPMKGTIDAATEHAREVLLSDPKETAEHTTIVDLIRNDLSMIARQVRVKEFRRIDLIRTNQKDLLQMSSEIVGTLSSQWRENVGTLLHQLLPAGSISGAPKRRTVEIILEAEEYGRGFYTGVCGYFDGDTLDSGVMIRFVEIIGGELFYKSWGGITASSSLMKEYQELVDKVYVPLV